MLIPNHRDTHQPNQYAEPTCCTSSFKGSSWITPFRSFKLSWIDSKTDSSILARIDRHQTILSSFFLWESFCDSITCKKDCSDKEHPLSIFRQSVQNIIQLDCRLNMRSIAQSVRPLARRLTGQTAADSAVRRYAAGTWYCGNHMISFQIKPMLERNGILRTLIVGYLFSQ